MPLLTGTITTCLAETYLDYGMSTRNCSNSRSPPSTVSNYRVAKVLWDNKPNEVFDTNKTMMIQIIVPLATHVELHATCRHTHPVHVQTHACTHTHTHTLLILALTHVHTHRWTLSLLNHYHYNSTQCTGQLLKPTMYTIQTHRGTITHTQHTRQFFPL